LNGVYPTEEAIYKEMSAFEKVLLKYDVQVFRPWTLENCNQVFARDVGFVIDDKIINSNIIPDREDEKEAYEVIYDQIAYNKIYNLPERAHVEGGDVVLYNDFVFLGLYTGEDYSKLKTARTNLYAFNFLKELFPEKTFYSARDGETRHRSATLRTASRLCIYAGFEQQSIDIQRWISIPERLSFIGGYVWRRKSFRTHPGRNVSDERECVFHFAESSGFGTTFYPAE